MKSVLILSGFISLSSLFDKDILTGRWESKPSEKGNITGVVFKPDQSYEGYVNKKVFVSGHYNLIEDSLSIIENGCDGKPGLYRLIFFHDGDSIRFEPLEDECIERMKGMSRTILGRIK